MPRRHARAARTSGGSPTGRAASSGDRYRVAASAGAGRDLERGGGEIPRPRPRRHLAARAPSQRRSRKRARFSTWYELFPALVQRERRRARHVCRLRGASALRRRDGLRRAVSPADPSDRPRAAQRPQQHADRHGRRRRQPVGDRRCGRRPHGGTSAARDARGFQRRCWPRRASTASRSRSTSRSSARPITRRSASIREWFRSGRTARCSTPRIRPRSTRTSIRSISRRTTGRRCGSAARRRVLILDRAGRAHLPRRQSAHQAVRVLGMG